MIIIPEIETVIILTPRTGTGSLRRFIAHLYPKSMLIYRHMEADGIPLGYDHWRRVGVVRHPIDRLWSLYKFLQNFGGDHDPAYIAAMRGSVAAPFTDWLVDNEIVFTSPYDRAGLGRYFPGHTVRHPLPENRKSQFVYLRPDLGTEVFRYDDLDGFHRSLGVRISGWGDRHNETSEEPAPPLSERAIGHVERFFAWDLSIIRGNIDQVPA